MDAQNSSAISPYQLQQLKVILLSILLTGGILTSFTLFNRHLRQIKTARDIPSHVFRKSHLFGKVTFVGDGDNFLFFHMPGGILGGWHWLRDVPSLSKISLEESTIRAKSKRSNKGRRGFLGAVGEFFGVLPKKYKFRDLQVAYKSRRNLPTIAVRLCGVDAPEAGHFGKTAQPFSEEAIMWLRHTLLGRYVWIKPLALDQYGRCIATVQYWSWFRWKNVSLEMIKEGLGVVYEGKIGAEFDGEEKLYRYHEMVAKKAKRGVWSLRNFETPGEYKKRLKINDN
ncbi:HER061Wp [Eremothecium sinecaudum]|uniref:Probable endonuclease LCL3 n=1 Tax=Eremothecium sinecaudum TaxID=45286 RepID=A0A0X8HTS7_9SACH|nr:HER061Wp [Eremothecium sinecaudum]AMD21340.1 HER061Wp [Eremothecium sinecaudum]